MSLTSLLTFGIGLICRWLRFPSVCEPATHAKAQAFSDYVERTWINGDLPPSLWSHYDNLAPRTTNVAEGWHNGLNNTFGVPHPSLLVFLDWLQRQQYEVQCRSIQLAAGRSPKQRRVTYMNADAQLGTAKLEYSTMLGKIFCYIWSPCVLIKCCIAHLAYVCRSLIPFCVLLSRLVGVLWTSR